MQMSNEEMNQMIRPRRHCATGLTFLDRLSA